MQDALSFVLGLGVLGTAFLMLREDTAARIRASRLWFIGWLGYLVLVILAFRLMAPVFNKIPDDNDLVVPCLLGGVLLLCGIMYVTKVCQLKRQIKG